jgi:hypothetical protein
MDSAVWSQFISYRVQSDCTFVYAGIREKQSDERRRKIIGGEREDGEGGGGGNREQENEGRKRI